MGVTDSREGAPQNLLKILRGSLGLSLVVSKMEGIVRKRLVMGWWGTWRHCHGEFSYLIISGGMGKFPWRYRHLRRVCGWHGGLGSQKQVLALDLVLPVLAHSCSCARALALPPGRGGAADLGQGGNRDHRSFPPKVWEKTVALAIVEGEEGLRPLPFPLAKCQETPTYVRRRRRSKTSSPPCEIYY